MSENFVQCETCYREMSKCKCSRVLSDNSANIIQSQSRLATPISLEHDLQAKAPDNLISFLNPHPTWASRESLLRLGSAKKTTELAKQLRHDNNFNAIKKSKIEITLVTHMMRNPTRHSLDAIAFVSSAIKTVLTSVDERHQTTESLLTELMGYKPIKDDIEQLLAWDSKELGRLPRHYQTWPIEKAILDVLDTKVTADNFLYHLKICQLVSVFVHRIHDNTSYSTLPSMLANKLMTQLANIFGSNEITYPDLLTHIFPNNTEMSGIRTTKIDERHASQIPGYLSREYFFSPTPNLIDAHARGVDRWRVSYNKTSSPFIRTAIKKDLPLIAGASGSVARWVCLLKYMGLEMTSPIGEIYTTNIMGYMVYSGHHSMHEVAVVLRKAGLTYRDGDFSTLLPDSALAIDTQQTIMKHFEERELPDSTKLERSLSF